MQNVAPHSTPVSCELLGAPHHQTKRWQQQQQHRPLQKLLAALALTSFSWSTAQAVDVSHRQTLMRAETADVAVAAIAKSGSGVVVENEAAIVMEQLLPSTESGAAASSASMGTWLNYTDFPRDVDKKLEEGRFCLEKPAARCSNSVAASFTIKHERNGEEAPKNCIDCSRRCRDKGSNAGVWFASFKGPCPFTDEDGKIAHEGSCVDGCECTCHLLDHCGDYKPEQDWNLLMWCDSEICASCSGRRW